MSLTAANSTRLLTGTWSAAPSQPVTVIAFGEIAAVNQYLFDGLSNNTLALATVSSNRLELEAGTALASGNNVYTPGSTGKAAFAGVFATTSKLYLNSSAAAIASGSAGAGSATGLSIGAAGAGGNPAGGKVAEIIVASGALTAAQISSAFSYGSLLYGGSWS
jgi:hypothetical protein